jgi:hypothetical protein
MALCGDDEAAKGVSLLLSVIRCCAIALVERKRVFFVAAAKPPQRKTFSLCSFCPAGAGFGDFLAAAPKRPNFRGEGVPPKAAGEG